MLRKLIILTLIVGFALPAQADNHTYLIFKRGETRSSEMWVGPEPTQKQIGDGNRARLWVPVKDESGAIDRDPRNYQDVGAIGIKRVPPVVETVESKPVPNVDQFFEDMITSKSFTEAEILKALIASRVKDDTKRNALILEMVAGAEPERQAALIDIAEKNHVELPIRK